MDERRICLIFNPKSGRKRAASQLAKIREAWRDHADFLATECAGHAEQLAKDAALSGAEMVVAVGGDGTVHEVANGLLQSQCPDVSLGVLPVGSANDYAWSLRREFADRAAQPQRVDVGYVRTSQGGNRFFLCCLGAGLNGSVTAESRKIQAVRGLCLYGLAALRALRLYRKHPHWTIAFDDSEHTLVDRPSLMISVLVGQREGNFRMAPQARLSDGLFDYIHTGPLTPMRALAMLPRLALAGPPKSHPLIATGQCRHVRLDSDSPLCVHVDGELLCMTDQQDAVRWIEIEMLPARLKVQLCSPSSSFLY